jgi:hypothetical protein
MLKIYFFHLTLQTDVNIYNILDDSEKQCGLVCFLTNNNNNKKMCKLDRNNQSVNVLLLCCMLYLQKI